MMQSYGGNIRRKETTGKTRHRWEDNIKIYHLREVGWNSIVTCITVYRRGRIGNWIY
jgi:hypothetical protein